MLLHSSLSTPTVASSPSPFKNPQHSIPLSSSSPHPPLFLLKFRTSHRHNLRYLTTLGIINPETKSHKNSSPETLHQILSTVNFFKSKGFRDADFPRLAFLCPELFSPVFDPTDVEPVLDFLSIDLAASDQESCGLILRCPRILLSNVEFCLRPTLVYLRELGLEKLNTPTNLNAHLLNTRVHKLEEKVRFLQGVGLSYEDSARVCARLPAIFGYSLENNLRQKIVYLVREMKRSVEEVKEFPQYFAYSLERRIAPRHLHLKQRNVEVPLKRMLLWSDQKFYAKWK
ncbi:transcription termination factor MTEF1, chloroplastic [Cornus florida]|uniref:transcription termination factor MTEF1, chloroplastic n=1 Tax=Cornus florida TaxID=4283 RepID=UPI00289C6A5E|nr:transcription termination factor MTEF1, chloroplastic [Cornus florida]